MKYERNACVPIPDIAKNHSVGVVLAEHNEGSEVVSTLESLMALRDEVGNLKVLVIDDGSTDGSCGPALDKLIEKNEWDVEIVRHPENQGLGVSRNEGGWRFTSLGRDSILWQDCHMRFKPGYLREMVGAIVGNEAFVCAGIQDFGKDTGSQGWGAMWRFHRRWRLGAKYNPVRSQDAAVQIELPYGGSYGTTPKRFGELGGWLDIAANWGHSEQTIGFRAWCLGMPVLAVPSVVQHKYRGMNPCGAGELEVWLNVACSYRLMFQEKTFEDYWLPIIRERLGETDIRRACRAADRYSAQFGDLAVLPDRTDRRFFEERLGLAVEGNEDGVSKVKTCSIILPCYNEGQEPKFTALSFKGSTVCDPELIFVDDFSDDGCCNRKSEDGRDRFHSHVRLLHNPRRIGVCRSRLTGIYAAREDPLLFADAHSRARPGDIDLMRATCEELDGIVVGTITALGETKPLYGGRFCVKPGWGLRLAYNLKRPVEVLPRINGPIGSFYGARREVWNRIRGWTPLPGEWAYSEQAIGVKAFNLGVPIYNETRILISHKMKKGEIPVPHVSVLLNAHFVHRAYFDEETYASVWRPILLERGHDPLIDEMLASGLLKDEANWFKAERRKTDADFFREVIGVTDPSILLKGAFDRGQQ